MVRNINNEYKPQSISHPGETVLDYLEFHGWTQRDLSLRTGITTKTISEICNRKTSISPQTAILFEKVLKRPAHFWLRLQQQYDEVEARNRFETRSHDWGEWGKKFPFTEMKKFGWFDDEGFQNKPVDLLLNFFGASSPQGWTSVWETTNVAYRQTRKFHTSIESISAWVRATEIMATQLESKVEIKEFNETKLYSAIENLRLFTRERVEEELIRKIQQLLASAGVLVVWTPELKHTGISGCSRWLSDKKALIAITLRYKTDDQMWFTFFHELGHILLHRKDKIFILDNAAVNFADQIIDPPMRAREEEANRFAADTLIPAIELFEFILDDDFRSDSIYGFAEKIGIAPGIVVGRLQHEGVLPYNQQNGFKQKLSWDFKE